MPLCFFIFTLTLPYSTSAQPENNKITTALTDLELQNKILQENLKSTKESSKEIHSIYMWALGFSATFLITFLGVNIYFLNSKSKDEIEKIIAKMKSLNEDSKKDIENHIKELFESNKDDILSIQKNTASNLKEKIAVLQDEQREIKLDALDIELELIEIKGVKATALSRHLELISFVIESYGEELYDWKITRSLAKIIELQNQGANFSIHDVAKVNKTLAKLPHQHQGLVAKIKESLT